MNAQILNRRLVLETPVVLPDGAGGFLPGWTVVGTLWGAIVPGASGEAAANGATLSRVTHRITLRAAPPGSPRRPTPAQRLRAGTRTFTILSVTEKDTHGRFLICLTEEEVAA